MKSKPLKLTLVYRTHRPWLGNPEKDSPLRFLSDRIVHFLTGIGEDQGRPLDVLRGTPSDFPEVTSKHCQFEVAGCKQVTWFSINEIYNLCRFDAYTGSPKVTSGVTYLEYLGKEFISDLYLLRVQAVERVIIGFD